MCLIPAPPHGGFNFSFDDAQGQMMAEMEYHEQMSPEAQFITGREYGAMLDRGINSKEAMDEGRG